MSKLKEEDLLTRLEEWRNTTKTELCNLWVKRDERAYKRIVELIKIFFAKEISVGPIKKDISRPDLIEWLQGINQAATAVKDHYVMKATTQLIDELRSYGKIQEYLDGVKAKICTLSGLVQLANMWDKKVPTNDWLPTAKNINALPTPVRNYIADMQTNADPPSMVADNIILRDTVKALEIKCEEKAVQLPEITEAWTDAKAKQIKTLIKDAQDEDLEDPVTSLHYLGLSLDIVTSIIDDLRPREK